MAMETHDELISISGLTNTTYIVCNKNVMGMYVNVIQRCFTGVTPSDVVVK